MRRKVHTIALTWQSYKLRAYEREIAFRELNVILKPLTVIEKPQSVEITSEEPLESIRKLTYFSSGTSGTRTINTRQALIESGNVASTAGGRQRTRYSVHGLHDYKGKFNPQMAHSLLNLLEVPQKGVVLDPFCGRGTTLVECARHRLKGIGLDVNPLAVFIANAKLRALSISSRDCLKALARVKRNWLLFENVAGLGDGRERYLRDWFPARNFSELETLRHAINMESDEGIKSVFLVIASDLLRIYSFQDPLDLRIRRRKTPPMDGVLDGFMAAAEAKICEIGKSVVPASRAAACRAIQTDSAGQIKLKGSTKVDAVLTSPPYATALPYIDTQRLSLVWLGLVDPADLGELQASLIGSREITGTSRLVLANRMLINAAGIPKDLHEYCLKLQGALSPTDGFRRNATPALIYRYLGEMLALMRNLRLNLKKGGRVAFVVGHNHTTLGGERFDIETPKLLQELAASAGFVGFDRLDFEAYQRYGLHQKNATSREEILFFRAP